MSNFVFLQKEFFAICDSATKAEGYLNTDARAACWYARMTLEQIVDWLYRYDNNFKCYETSLGARVHDPSFKDNVGEAIFTKATVVIGIGNRAAHAKATKKADAVIAIQELFHVAYWLARTYGERARPNPALQFDEALVPAAKQERAVSVEQLKRQEDALRAKDAENAALKEKLDGLSVVHAELEALRAEIAKAKAENTKVQDTHDYNEEQTRDYFIDMLLHEAGWALDKAEDREFEVQGMPNNKGVGYVDYVLWGDDGLPLAVVEAKRTKRDATVGQQQAKLYADCLEAKYKRRPVIFYTNGYEYWFWDDKAAPPRRVQGFYKKAELELLMQRRTGKKSIALEQINSDIAGRGYQQQAIRSVTEAMEKHNQRRSLIVMATGSGKTRTVIALVDLLSRCSWVKRVLFLADRVSLVKQATKEFNKHLPNAGVVNLLDSQDGQGRVYVSTYPTMLNLINSDKDDTRQFGVGHFDLVIVDEAHRSIYAKYGAIFDYFDSYLVGLTATPKDEIDHNTYGMFQLQRGVPTYAYALEDAIADGYLVPPKAVSVPLKFQRKGIKYSELSDEEKAQWDELDWGEQGAPDEVDAAALNNWLFNEQTVDLVLEHLMTKGERVASGDRLGKTIIFAKNNRHAEYIAERFNINYPEYKGHFARVITYQTEYAQSLIDSFSVKDKEPHIAISVDMLDTGIDVPEVVNLVFFKLVRSKTKFWQMIGRGTRLCPDLYAPSQDKKFFYIFDFLQNLEYFAENPEATDGAVTASLEARLFKARLELITSLDASSGDNKTGKQEEQDGALRKETAAHLHSIVSNMTFANMIVRTKRRHVEKYSVADAWKAITPTEAVEIGNELANLPSQLIDTEEEAKRFDLLILKMQLCVLNKTPGFDGLKTTIQKIAAALELQESIPAIRAQMVLIQSIGTDEWWQDITVGMLEAARKQLRLLVKLIEKGSKSIIYTQFEDEIGEGEGVDLPLVPAGLDYEKFKSKTRAFLKQHNDRLALQKLRRNLPVTTSDLQELEKILLEQASGNASYVDMAREEGHGLGLWVRSLVGLDRNAAVEAMAEFLNDKNATASQLEFAKMIVEYLTVDGAIDAGRLYETPFTSISSTGPDTVFGLAKVERLFAVIEDIRQRAVA
ncbi:DEAD/DEAH box helicase family protein [Polynucleobacter sp. HIN9]|uniref:DEAD/DEAH box helicase family protein n=1 Tax=Polynucleobacter sp. HIN9 TaxID=3047868 RepID=UPI0025733655|nr:DEAD/DEAH box helicase family protein [Polynucleobacter sp. HIN9]BEI40641.1 DEAD/DEAH box helicase family protein [Polynucleobacter sp. HIN9]